MSNQTNHRRAANQRNKRHNERPVPASGCRGEGKNGQLGRADWKLRSRRNERRNNKQGRPASIGKLIKKTTPRLHAEYGVSPVRRIDFMPKPTIPDTGEDEY